MSIVAFQAVVSFGLTCFGLGYTFGKDNNKSHKNNRPVCKLSEVVTQSNSVMNNPFIFVQGLFKQFL